VAWHGAHRTVDSQPLTITGLEADAKSKRQIRTRAGTALSHAGRVGPCFAAVRVRGFDCPM